MMLISWFTGCMYEHPYTIGDGVCNDETNNEGCSYDGGDCCGPNVDTQYCTDCICYADLDCAAPLELIGNGFCNDEANTAGCSYDGGDCCADCANTNLCTDCTCHDEGSLPLDISCKSKYYFQDLLERFFIIEPDGTNSLFDILRKSDIKFV